MSMPLPVSDSRDAIEPTIVTSSPSRIQTVPSPTTTRQWNFAQGSRSSRAGIFVVIVPVDASMQRRYCRIRAPVITLASPHARLPRTRPPLPLHERRADDAMALPARLRRRRREGVRQRGRRRPLRRGARPRGPRRARQAAGDAQPAAAEIHPANSPLTGYGGRVPRVAPLLATASAALACLFAPALASAENAQRDIGFLN